MDGFDANAIHLLGVLSSLPAPTLLTVFIIGLWRRWWVMGWYAVRLEDELDGFKEAAARGTELAETFRDIAVPRPSKPATRIRRRATTS